MDEREKKDQAGELSPPSKSGPSGTRFGLIHARTLLVGARWTLRSGKKEVTLSLRKRCFQSLRIQMFRKDPQ